MRLFQPCFLPFGIIFSSLLRRKIFSDCGQQHPRQRFQLRIGNTWIVFFLFAFSRDFPLRAVIRLVLCFSFFMAPFLIFSQSRMNANCPYCHMSLHTVTHGWLFEYCPYCGHRFWKDIFAVTMYPKINFCEDKAISSESSGLSGLEQADRPDFFIP